MNQSGMLIDEWPADKCWYKAVLLQTGGEEAHLILGRDTHAVLLKRFLDSRNISYEKDTRFGYTPPKAKGSGYESLGMGEFEVGMFGQEMLGIFAGLSETYGLMITDVAQVAPVIEFHRRSGILLPKYTIVVRGLDRVAYAPGE